MWSAMGRSISDTAKAVISFAPNARNSVPNSKVLLLGTFAALLVLVAVPVFFRVAIPQVTASSTLKCYDSAGNHEPCLMHASASQPRFDDRTTDHSPQPPSWITTALYQQATWTTTALYQPASWATTALHQPASSTTTAPGDRAQQCARKTRSIRHLPATFHTMLLFSLAKAAYPYGFAGEGSTRQGTAVADAVSFVPELLVNGGWRPQAPFGPSGLPSKRTFQGPQIYLCHVPILIDEFR